MSEEKAKEFKEKLDKLLNEYDAHINWYYGPDSDKYGIYDDYVSLTFRKSDKGIR